jgi:hypothetical protein
MSGVSNKAGLIRFERVRYGTYHLNVSNNANERFATVFTLQPGRGLTRTIVVPDPATESVKVTTRIAWPQDLSDRRFWFRFQEENVYREVASASWKPPAQIISHEHGGYPTNDGVLAAPNGDIASASWNIFRPQLVRSASGSLSIRGDRSWVRYGVSATTVMRATMRGEPLIEAIEGILWPGRDYKIGSLEVLIPEAQLTSLEELTNPPSADQSSARRSRGGRSSERTLNGIRFKSADWSFRIEPGTADKLGTLWLTPSGDAVKTVRAALAEIDQEREAAVRVQADAAKVRAERQQQEPTAPAPADAKKDGAEDS